MTMASAAMRVRGSLDAHVDRFFRQRSLTQETPNSSLIPILHSNQSHFPISRVLRLKRLFRRQEQEFGLSRAVLYNAAAEATESELCVLQREEDAGPTEAEPRWESEPSDERLHSHLKDDFFGGTFSKDTGLMDY
jgi:hypothetical protein